MLPQVDFSSEVVVTVGLFIQPQMLGLSADSFTILESN